MRTLVYGLCISVLALSILTGVQFAQINKSRQSGRADARAVWHSVICTIQRQQLANPKITDAQRTKIVTFWTQLLVDQVHTTPCAPSKGATH